jgi:hypothetical protein
LLSGSLGGLIGAYLVGHVDRGSMVSAAAAAAREDVMSARRIQLIDASGRTRALLAMSPDGGPGLFFYDTTGRNRLVLGLYAPVESEYPFVVLNDGEQRAAGIFRLFGSKETPVVVLKNKGQDRSIYGLNPNSTEPFLANYSNGGAKTSAFGTY